MAFIVLTIQTTPILVNLDLVTSFCPSSDPVADSFEQTYVYFAEADEDGKNARYFIVSETLEQIISKIQTLNVIR